MPLELLLTFGALWIYARKSSAKVVPLWAFGRDHGGVSGY
jgi:hypothetical protein